MYSDHDDPLRPKRRKSKTPLNKSVETSMTRDQKDLAYCKRHGPTKGKALRRNITRSRGR